VADWKPPAMVRQAATLQESLALLDVESAEALVNEAKLSTEQHKGLTLTLSIATYLASYFD